MSASALICLWAAITFLAIQIGTCAAAAARCRRRGFCVAPAGAPPISLVRPLCGIEPHLRETLEANFQIDYPTYEILFCVASPDDPVIPFVRAAIHAHPRTRARLLIGDDPISSNPKLNNMVKAWRDAEYEHIVFADSNLLTPPDYLACLARAWSPGAGLVSSAPVGGDPEGFWGELECAFLNSYEARWQFAADSLGIGFAQGKTLFYRRSLLPGGIESLAAEPAEDAASTKAIRAQGLKVRLATPAFFQPVGRRRFSEVWSRQARWSRLRRATFLPFFVPELLTGLAVPGLLAMVGLLGAPVPLAPTLLVFALVWYTTEIILCVTCGWPLSWRLALALVLRDLLIPALWLQAFAGDDFVWKGQAIQGSGRARSFAEQPLRRRFLPIFLSTNASVGRGRPWRPKRSVAAMAKALRSRPQTRRRILSAVRLIAPARRRDGSSRD